MSLPLTPMERLSLLLEHDAKNIAHMPVLPLVDRLKCVVSCAEHYLEAKGMGQEIERRAFGHLRKALEQR
jgi:hypothetical protein